MLLLEPVDRLLRVAPCPVHVVHLLHFCWRYCKRYDWHCWNRYTLSLKTERLFVYLLEVRLAEESVPVLLPDPVNRPHGSDHVKELGKNHVESLGKNHVKALAKFTCKAWQGHVKTPYPNPTLIQKIQPKNSKKFVIRYILPIRRESIATVFHSSGDDQMVAVL
jgi:hypothetical protein